jgi:serine/threonine-protein kinase
VNDSLLGQQLDEYRLDELLGQGGMARVYLAMDVRLRRYAAIKVIDSPFRNDPEYIGRFEREAQAIARLQHPHIVRLYRYGKAHDVLYMAMQHIEGSDLQLVLRRYEENGEFMEPQEAGRIISEICGALDYAHSKGVIHRDIKPSNIMLDTEGRAILTDFGLVLITEVGTLGEVFGTPQYIAPEQAISSATALPQSDLYSVGVVLYRIFTGVLPFDGSDSLDVAMRHMTEPPRPPRQIRPEVPAAVQAVILKVLAKEPSDRYPTGEALAGALRQALQQPSAQILISAVHDHHTIAQRVAMDMSTLPPIPVVSTPPEVVEDSTRVPAALPPRENVVRPAARESGRNRSRPSLWLALTGGAILLVALCLLVLVGIIMARNGGFPLLAANGTEESSLATAEAVSSAPPNTSSAEEVSATRTAEAGIENTPTVRPSATLPATSTTQPTSPTPTLPPPSPTPADYELLIVTNGGESLFLMNRSSQPFPLGPLFLGEDDEGVNGTEWEVNQLQPGDCVTIWRGNGRPEAPDIECEVVGARLTRRGNQIFWNNDFEVLYNDEEIGSCEEDDEECLITFSP